MHPLNKNYIVIKKLHYTIGLVLLFSFTVKKETPKKNISVETPQPNIVTPVLQKDFIGFKEAIGFSESRGMYHMVNRFGYLGKYQFGKPALRYLKIYNTRNFLNNPKLQEKAFESLCKVNKRILRKYIDKYSGRIVDGIEITESGILAAAHLAGAGSVRKFLKSQGKRSFRDGFGTSIKSYFKKFGGYDVSYIYKADYNVLSI